MQRLFKRARNLAGIIRFIRPITDVPRYVRYLNKTSRTLPEGVFRVRQCPGIDLVCRPNTTDGRVLQDSFDHEYHLPEEPLPPRPVILDLGANVGFVAAHYAVLYPAARIISVELDAENARCARRTLAPFGDRVTVVTGAIWREDGMVRYGGQEEWGFHIEAGADHAAPPDGAAGRQARAMTIDTLMREQGLDHVDFLKMDLEGAELDVLRAGGQWAARTALIGVEYHRPLTAEEVGRALAELGFEVRQSTSYPRQLVGVRRAMAARPDAQVESKPGSAAKPVAAC